MRKDGGRVFMNRREQNSFSKGRTFLIGFLVGLLVSAFIVIGLAGYIIRYPQKVFVKAVDLGMNRVVEKTVQSIPKDYISERQEDIAASAQRFTRAFSKNRISPADMRFLSSKFFTVVADQKITSDEIDEFLRLIDRFSQ